MKSVSKKMSRNNPKQSKSSLNENSNEPIQKNSFTELGELKNRPLLNKRKILKHNS